MTAPTAGSGMKWVGRAIRRLEDPALVRGRGRFTADIAAALHVRFVRSPCAVGPHPAYRGARRRGDMSPPRSCGARNRSGRCCTSSTTSRSSSRSRKSVVRFVGEPVAAVNARTAAEAEDIADAVEIEIEELPAVIDAHDALAPDAPRVHPSGNVVVDGAIKSADFDATLAKRALPHPFRCTLVSAERDAARNARRARGL